jgi:hypothetical protein
VACLADQKPKTNHPQIPAFAFGMPAASQFAWRHRRDVGVKVRGVERQHVGRKLKPAHSRFRNRDLRLL